MTRSNIEYQISEFGDASVIKEEKTQLSRPDHGQVQLRMLAAGLSMADVLIRRGVYLDIKKPGDVAGYEGVAVIENLGEGVSMRFPDLVVGKQVAVMSLTGNHTSFRNIDAQDVVPFPNSVDVADIPSVASLMLNYVTAYQMIHRQALSFSSRGDVKRVLIHSAAGGVGNALIQLLKPLNVELYGTASLKNHERLKTLGVEPIDYNNTSVAQMCQSAGGMDVVFDGIGGSHLNLSNNCLKAQGHLVFYGMTELITGEQPSRMAFLRYLTASAWYLLKSKLSTRYSFYSITDFRAKEPSWFHEDFNQVFNLYRKGQINPDLAPLLPLSKLAVAHRKLERGELQGKQVLIPDALFDQYI